LKIQSIFFPFYFTKSKTGERKRERNREKNRKKESRTSTDQTDGWNETGGILKRKPDDNAS
jgi:hypothetical protein